MVTKKEEIKIVASQFEIAKNCNGSLDFTNSVNIYKSSEIANRGTEKHKNYENFLKLNYKSILKKENFDKIITASKLENSSELHELFVIYKTLMQLYLSEKSIFMLEERFETKEKNYTFVARIDLLIIDNESKKIYVIDYKTGFNPVRANKNSQLELTFEILNRNKIIKSGYSYNGIIINTVLEDISYTSYTPKDSFFSDLVSLLDSKTRKLVLGEHCRYCQFNTICPELKKNMQKFLNPKYRDVKFDRVKIYKDFLQNSFVLKSILEDLENEIKNYLEFNEIEGFYLDLQNSKRVYIPDLSTKALSKALKVKEEILTEKKLLNIVDLEKKLNAKQKEIFQNFLVQPKIKKIKKITSKFSS